MTQTAGMIETVKDALLADLRARFGDHVTDPALDITLIVPPMPFTHETRAPQIILTDFILVPSWPQGMASIEVARNEDEGWIDVTNAPVNRHVEFAVTAAARTSRAAERMGEALTAYFGSRMSLLEFTVGEGDEAHTFRFTKELAAEFRDATIGNEGGLFWQEGRGRIVNVPIFDGSRERRYLVKETDVTISDQDSEAELAAAHCDAGEEEA